MDSEAGSWLEVEVPSEGACHLFQTGQAHLVTWWRETTDRVVLNSPWLRRDTGRFFRCLWIFIQFALWLFFAFRSGQFEFVWHFQHSIGITLAHAVFYVMSAFLGASLWTSLSSPGEHIHGTMLFALAVTISFRLLIYQIGFPAHFSYTITFVVLCHCNPHPGSLFMVMCCCLGCWPDFRPSEMALSFEITIIEWLHELAFQCALLFTFALDFTCRVQAVSSGILFGSSEDVLESPVAGRSARRSCWCSGLNQWILWIVVTWKNQMKSESITHIDASFLRNHLVFSSIWVPALSAVLALAATKTWPCRAARLAFFRDVALAFFCCAPVALLMVNLRCSDPGGQRRPYLWYVYTNQMSQMGLALFVAAAQTLVQAGCHPLVCTVSVLLMTVPTVLMDSDWIFSVAINGELAISPRVGMIALVWFLLLSHWTDYSARMRAIQTGMQQSRQNAAASQRCRSHFEREEVELPVL